MKKKKLLLVAFLYLLAVWLMNIETVNAQSVTASSVVTGYSSLDSCNTKLCLMASGKSAYIGAVACPTKLHLGTTVQINGKVYTCEDRTAKRFNGRYDIFFGYGKEAHQKALTWGIKRLDVSIVKMVK